MMDAILSNALLIYMIVATQMLGVVILAALVDRKHLEPDRQKLLAKQRKEDCRHCRGSGEGFSALVRKGWDGTLFHPFLDQRDADFSGVRCEGLQPKRSVSMQQAFERLGETFRALALTIVTEALPKASVTEIQPHPFLRAVTGELRASHMTTQPEGVRTGTLTPMTVGSVQYEEAMIKATHAFAIAFGPTGTIKCETIAAGSIQRPTPPENIRIKEGLR